MISEIYPGTLKNPKIVPRRCKICNNVFYVSLKEGKRIPKGVLSKRRKTCSPTCSEKYRQISAKRYKKRKKPSK